MAKPFIFLTALFGWFLLLGPGVASASLLGNKYSNIQELEVALQKQEDWEASRLLLLDAPIYQDDKEAQARFLISRDHCGRSLCTTYLIKLFKDDSLEVLGVFSGKPVIKKKAQQGHFDIQVELSQGNKKEFETVKMKYQFNGKVYEDR